MFPELENVNAPSVDLIKTNRITSQLAVLEPMLRNEPLYWQEMKPSATPLSAYFSIRSSLRSDKNHSVRLVALITSEQLLDGDAMAGIPIYAEEVVKKLV